MVVQYNLYGDEEVTDLDGEVLSEKQAARKWRILFTPHCAVHAGIQSQRKRCGFRCRGNPSRGLWQGHNAAYVRMGSE